MATTETTRQATTMLRELSDTGEMVAHPDEDVRGRKVLDSSGEEIGTVDGLMVDDETTVRALRVASGGFLGLDRTRVMIPVEAVTRVMPHAVSIDRGREHLRGAPLYDPDLVDDTDRGYWGGLYGYYGFPPYGGRGRPGIRRQPTATTTLRMLSDTGETVAHADEDVRGRKVVDDAGEEIGSVDGLMVDGGEKVRFLRVASGGFLGLDRTRVMIPVEAVTRVMPHAVSIDRGREHLRGAPLYDPDLVDDTDRGYWGSLYGYYGYAPYWGFAPSWGLGRMGMGYL